MPTYTRSGVEQFEPRLTVSCETEGLHMSTAHPRDWAAILGVALWLGFWTFLGLHSWHTLNHFSLFTAVWAFGELWGSFAILDNVGGSEIIMANSDALTRTRKIFAIGWSKTYPVREIRNLRFERGSGRRPSRIAFDYGARIIRFGKYVEEAEACDLMRRIRQRCAIAEDSAG
jgi:hypothetical protein